MNRQDDLIYDVGANNGDDIEYYLHKGFRVLAIEADPTLMEPLQARFAGPIADGRVTLLNVALAPERTTAPFWICEEHSLWSSFDREIASRDGCRTHAVELQCWPLRDMFARFGIPHYLKLSLHGQEHFCLADLSPETAPALLSLELPRDKHEAQAILTRLVALGYRGFKVIDQTNYLQVRIATPTLRIKIRRRLKRAPRLYKAYMSVKLGLVRPFRSRGNATAGDSSFPVGSSGPFGRDTDGPWHPPDEALRKWEMFISHLPSNDEEQLSIWHDLHASLHGTVGQRD